jgi:hypothetical protein
MHVGADLPGEHSGRPTPEYAARWAAIYGELIDQMEDVLGALQSQGAMTDAGYFLARLKRRRAFWEEQFGQQVP